ncbi:hypothetical protein [Salinilacihabitans rarus]|uniref:hypothetical protein n=1 Tax=Salinilacihabitans rarus TaxID=2961596 RepID=UPI0020C87BDB|nr:hypothetical protein [Salinilacihabitans rarus]
MAEELVQQIDACYEDRGFSNRSEFIRSAVRDAIQAEDPFTEEARQGIEEARQQYKEEDADDLDPVLEQLGLDPLPDVEEEAQQEASLTPELYEEGQDTWTDETDVTIVGLGGAGARIVTRLHSEDLTAADTVVIDSDEDTLDETMANTRLYLELPTDSDTHTSETEQIEHILENSQEMLADQIFSSTDLVFIVSGIGGYAGTAMTPIISRAARNAGAVVTTISTLPHTLEQERRQRARSDIQKFQANSDTFVLIDAARFASFTPELSPGQVFETINEYLEEALQQMVQHRKYIGEIADGDEQTGLASFFRGGGYATFSTLSTSEVGEFTEARDQLFQRSLVDQASDTTGNLLHLVRVNMNKIAEADTAALIQTLSGEPKDLTPNKVSINIVQDNEMDAALRLTSIVTGLDLSLDDIISESEETPATKEEGGLVVKRDNTAEEAQRRDATPQTQSMGSASPA